MRRLAQKCIAWTALAVFSVASFCGDKLHLLTESDRGCGSSCASDRHGEHESAATRPTDGQPAVDASSHDGHDEAACVICRFFAQAQAFQSLPADCAVGDLVSSAAVVCPLLVEQRTFFAYESRGPPA